MTELKPNAHRDGSRGVISSQQRRRTFLRHLVEMVLAMVIGMFVAVGIFVSVVGGPYDEARHEEPTAALLVMAIGMTAPMVAWMRVRRHSWRDSTEMGAAMMFPALPFLVLLWCHVTSVALTGPYMALSTAAMLALMFYRWDVYSTHPVARLRPRTR
jgi:flagellar biosynthetic protein FliP